MRKLLILESAWRKTPDGPTTETRSASELYGNALRLPEVDPIAVETHPLQAATLRDHITRFLAYPENQRGVATIILSGHGHYDPATNQRTLAMDDGAHAFVRLLRDLPLHRVLLVLDACQIGAQPEKIVDELPVLGVVGFDREVNWTGSGVLIHALLRQWLQAGVFHLRRASGVRPRKVLEMLVRGEYATLSNGLGLCFAPR